MRLIISAVNFTEGGPLKILCDAVSNAIEYYPNWEIIVLVNHVGTIKDNRITEIEFPRAKKSWLYRLWLEWLYFKRLSIKLQPDVWLSLHDITPRVFSRRQYVYCHNPAPFCSEKLSYLMLEKKFFLFKYFYGFLYSIFIKRNDAVIVQQEWLRNLFIERYRINRVIVAQPQEVPLTVCPPKRRASLPKLFFYPALPRVFKNFELLGNCIEILEKNSQWHGEIIVTIDGTENLYASAIYKKFKHLKTLKFIGILNPNKVQEYYSMVDALIFPSFLETWGLPLSEAKNNRLPILVADLPYAHETIGSYDRVRFFSPHDAEYLAALMLDLHLGRQGFRDSMAAEIGNPYASNWKDLFGLLLDQSEIPSEIH